MRREQFERAGFSCSRARSRDETGPIMDRATLRKPEWHRLPASSWISQISDESSRGPQTSPKISGSSPEILWERMALDES